MVLITELGSDEEPDDTPDSANTEKTNQEQPLRNRKQQPTGAGEAVLIATGLSKEIIVKADDQAQQPKPGQVCVVHYVGRLQSNGMVFDSSRSRGQPFSFVVGSGQVIRGWDLGLLTMKKG